MQLGVIADDFTGASDVANTLARGGLATLAGWRSSPGSASGTCRSMSSAPFCSPSVSVSMRKPRPSSHWHWR